MDNITKIQFRRDTKANWESANPVLSLGEPGLEVAYIEKVNPETGYTTIDTRVVGFKIGDGESTWSDLEYQTGDYTTLAAQVETNTEDISTNSTDINSLGERVSSLETINSEQSSSLQEINNQLSINTSAIALNVQNINSLQSNLSDTNINLSNEITARQAAVEAESGIRASEDRRLDDAIDDEIHNRTQADQALSNSIASVSDSLTALSERITQDLANYYTKSETYSREQVNNLITAIPKYKTQVVEELPEENISTTTVYLVPDASGEAGNLYTEYVYVNNGTDENPDWKWETLGTQSIDLDGYITDNDLSLALSNYQELLTAGENISIENNVISATGVAIPEVSQLDGIYTLKCIYQNNKATYVWERSVPSFSFNIDSNSYYGGNNINWMTWVSSIYNTDGYSIQNYTEVVNINGEIVTDNGTPVQPLDTIISGTTYTLQSQSVE